MNALPPKKEVALALLEQGVVRVFLDPRREGVVVPPWFKKQPQLLLDVGLNMPIPINDLQVDEVGITCTLSFNRAPFYCIMPWNAVFALVGDGQRGMIWPDDVPAEVQLAAKPAQPEREPPKLSVVPPPPADEPAVDPAAKRKAKRAAKKAASAPVVEGEVVEVAPTSEKPARKTTSKAPASKRPRAKKAAGETPEPAEAPRLVEQPVEAEPVAAKPLRESDHIEEEAPPPFKPKKRELPPYLRVVK